MRGEDHRQGGHVRPASGNTPTCVGKTFRGAPESDRRGKHPHVRGEDFCTDGGGNGIPETPPRAWGRHHAEWLGIASHRNTPTCVGKTLWAVMNTRHRQKHPHVRGEDPNCATVLRESGETPPRAWGRPQRPAIHHILLGNTPTCVGKTRCTRRRCRQDWKHPHVRGEDPNPRDVRSARLETPPRAWGRPTTSSYSSCLPWKHPHVRGEDSVKPIRMAAKPETPPRAWGRHRPCGGASAKGRNTPTCVGKTVVFAAGQFLQEKHPHVRGEDTERLFTFFIEPSKQY